MQNITLLVVNSDSKAKEVMTSAGTVMKNKNKKNDLTKTNILLNVMEKNLFKVLKFLLPKNTHLSYFYRFC